MDRGAWQAKVHRVAKSQAQLINFHSLIVVHSSWAYTDQTTPSDMVPESLKASATQFPTTE